MSKTVKIRQDLTDPPDQVKPPLVNRGAEKRRGFFSRNTPDRTVSGAESDIAWFRTKPLGW